jgi:trans-2,3-dihydro-3-hydroxyanthranilate isomerase
LRGWPAPAKLEYVHVDVFAARPFEGNSLPVFLDANGLGAREMLAITQELRQFEAIFLATGDEPGCFRARIFDLFEELPFAGHPIIGAAAALHHVRAAPEQCDWIFRLRSRSVPVATRRTDGSYFGWLDQGPATFGGAFPVTDAIASAFGLETRDVHPDLPLAVVSTGLAYLIVPVRPDVLPKAKIGKDITNLVRSFGAQFAVLFDECALEIRHWNNDGIIEDIATGSAAGTIGAYRLRYCGAKAGRAFALRQGRFVGRPSELIVEPNGVRAEVDSVRVGGSVSIVGRGVLEALPDAA